MKKSLKDLKSDYGKFISKIEGNLSIIKSRLGKEELDFSKNEIDVFFELYINNSNEACFRYLFYTYVGKAFIKHNGGEWSLSLMKKDKAYGSPIIINWGGENYPWVRISPLIWINRINKGIFEGKLSDVIIST